MVPGHDTAADATPGNLYEASLILTERSVHPLFRVRENRNGFELKEKQLVSEDDRIVFGGVDTHRDVHVAAVVDATGRLLDTATFSADATGYEQLGDWLGSWGRVAQVGIEGTGSYGAGLTRHLMSIGVEVAEVNRPNRQLRRRLE